MTTTTITPAMLRALRFLRSKCRFERPGIMFNRNSIPPEHWPGLMELVRAGLLGKAWKGRGVLVLRPGAYGPLIEAQTDPQFCLGCFGPGEGKGLCLECERGVPW